MKLNIITPFTRTRSNLVEIYESIQKITKAEVRWIIVYQEDKEDELITGDNIVTINGGTECIYGNKYRNIGIDYLEFDESYTYFLDDDNIIHPNFDLLLENVEKDVVFFSQIFPNQMVRLLPTEIKVGGVDTAMFLTKTKVIKNYRWEEEHYTADGILAEQLAKLDCQYIYTPYSFYNYLQETIFNENLVPRKKILAYMDFDSPTGFATVAHNVLDRITPWCIENKIRIDVAALNYGIKPHKRYNQVITILNPIAFSVNEDDFYWRDGILKLLTIGDYDLFWAMNDVPVIGPMADFIKKLQTKKEFERKNNFKTLFYTPIDSLPFHRYFANLNFFDEIVTYTEYGKAEAEKAFYRANKNPLTKPKFAIIAHGVDKKSFYKLDNKQKLREKYDLPKDKIIFGNFNTNTPRKDFGTTLIAFWYLKNSEYGKDCVLYLHTDPKDEKGINIYIAAERMGLKPGVDIFLPLEEKFKEKNYKVSELNELYNCLDCFVTTTTAEGWGLTVTEAMACELPIICGMHTSLNEITNNGELVYPVTELYDHIQLDDADNIRAVLSPRAVYYEMIKVITDIHSNKVKKEYKSKMDEYDWDKIAEEWKIKLKLLLSISGKD